MDVACGFAVRGTEPIRLHRRREGRMQLLRRATRPLPLSSWFATVRFARDRCVRRAVPSLLKGEYQ